MICLDHHHLICLGNNTVIAWTGDPEDREMVNLSLKVTFIHQYTFQ